MVRTKRKMYCAEAEGSLAPVTWRRVEAELSATAGNVKRTARRLGVRRSTLRYWIEMYELEDVVPRD